MNGPIITVDYELGDLFKIFNNNIDQAVDFVQQLKLDFCWQLLGPQASLDDKMMITTAHRYIKRMKLFSYVPNYIIIVPFEWSMLFTHEKAVVRFYIACKDPVELNKNIRSALKLLVFL